MVVLGISEDFHHTDRNPVSENYKSSKLDLLLLNMHDVDNSLLSWYSDEAFRCNSTFQS